MGSRWGGGVMPEEDPVKNYYGMQWGAIGYAYVQKASEIATQILSESGKNVCEKVNTRCGFDALRAFVVFNPTERPEHFMVMTERICLSEQEKSVFEFCVKNQAGDILPFQMEEEYFDAEGKRTSFKICWRTDKIPAIGYDTYYLCQGTSPKEKATMYFMPLHFWIWRVKRPIFYKM